MPCSLVGIAQFAEIVAVYNRTNHHGSRALQRLTYIPLMAGNAGLALNMPASIIASARTDRESKPYDHAAVPNVPASKHNRHGRRNNRRHAYSMVDRQSPLRLSLGSHSRDSRTRSRDRIPSNPRRSRSQVRRPGMLHSNRHIPPLRTQYRGEEPKESASSVWLPFPSRRKPSRGDQQCSYLWYSD